MVTSMFKFIGANDWWILFIIGICSYTISAYLFNFLDSHAGKTILSLITLICQVIIWIRFGFFSFLFSALLSFALAVLVARIFYKLSGGEDKFE